MTGNHSHSNSRGIIRHRYKTIDPPLTEVGIVATIPLTPEQERVIGIQHSDNSRIELFYNKYPHLRPSRESE